MQNNTAVTYGNQSASEVTREPEVQVELRKVVEISEVLEKQVADLEMRLTAVLAQRNDGSASETKPPEPVRVLLAQTIHDRYRHLAATSACLQSIMARLEV